MLEEILSFIFPDRCIECGKDGSALCAICERMITMKPLALSGTTATLFDYRNPLVKKAIWSLKYKRKRSLGRYFGTALYREFFKQLAHNGKGGEEIILAPIPASTKAVNVRGYNHAAIIAETIRDAGRADGLELRVAPNLLYKKRENEAQARTKSRSKRFENTERIFAVEGGEEIEGKTVILIDDVITTGATIADAKRAIKVWKPKRILAIAAAH